MAPISPLNFLLKFTYTIIFNRNIPLNFEIMKGAGKSDIGKFLKHFIEGKQGWRFEEKIRNLIYKTVYTIIYLQYHERLCYGDFCAEKKCQSRCQRQRSK